MSLAHVARVFLCVVRCVAYSQLDNVSHLVMSPFVGQSTLDSGQQRVSTPARLGTAVKVLG